MERLIVARHGESEASAGGTLNGDPSVAVGLTVEGRAQAHRLGERLAAEPLELCVVSEFARTRQTAEIALAGRDVPFLVVAELNDHPAGRYEGRPFAEYLAWAHAAGPDETIPGTAESRAGVVERLVRGCRLLLARHEPVVLAVLHSLPISYLLGAAAGVDPAARLPMLPYAEPQELSAEEVEAALERLERWCASPAW